MEEAVETSPPWAVTEKIVVEAKLFTRKGSAACPSISLSVRRVDWVEEPAMVTALLTSGVVVPMPRREFDGSIERKSAELMAEAPP